MRRRRSLRRDVGVLDDLRPLRGFFDEEARRFGGRGADRFQHEGAQPRADVGTMRISTMSLLICSAMPAACRVARRSRTTRRIGTPAIRIWRWSARQGARASAPNWRWPEFSAVPAWCRAQRGDDGIEHHVDVAGDDVVERWPGAAIGHMHHGDAGARLEQLGREVGGRADALRREGELAGIGLGERDESAIELTPRLLRITRTFGTVATTVIGTNLLGSGASR